jgi:hypothetical protein
MIYIIPGSPMPSELRAPVDEGTASETRAHLSENRLLGGKTDGAVEANRLSVEVVIGNDRQGQLSVFVGAPQSPGTDNLLAELGSPFVSEAGQHWCVH